MQKCNLTKKSQMLLKMFLWEASNSKFCIFNFTMIFFFNLSCSISHIHNLDYIIIHYSDAHFYKLSENIYFYMVIFNRFYFIFSIGVSRPVNEWSAIILECANTHQYLFRRAIVTCAKLYMMS